MNDDVKRHQKSDLIQMQSLPLNAKIIMTKQRIKVWYESWCKFKITNTKTGKTRFVVFDTRGDKEPPLKKNEYSEYVDDGQVYVSFSGGKDLEDVPVTITPDGEPPAEETEEEPDVSVDGDSEEGMTE